MAKPGLEKKKALSSAALDSRLKDLREELQKIDEAAANAPRGEDPKINKEGIDALEACIKRTNHVIDCLIYYTRGVK